MKRILFAGLVVGGVSWWAVQACAPMIPLAYLVFSKHPDFPRSRYASGNIGVLQPKYARSYHYVAYRYFSGVGFNQAEQEQLLALWRDRETAWFDNPRPDWTRRWAEAKSKALGTPLPPKSKPIKQERFDSSTQSTTLNCADDAIATAIATLADRTKRYPSRRYVSNWIAAQDKIFEACGSEETKSPSLAPAEEDAPALVRADRDYQIAAAAFYAGDLDNAEERFAAIANDRESPWREIAPYLVARTQFRIAHALRDDKEYHAKAEATLRAILADPQQSRYHEPAQLLLNRVLYYGDPERRTRELSASLMRRNSEHALRYELWDYTRLLDGYEFDNAELKGSEVPRDTDLTAWILSMRDQAKVPEYDRWKSTKSLPWLVSALAHAKGSERHRTELLQAASHVPPSSPAYPTVAFHAIRLMIESGNPSQAREQVDTILNSHARRWGQSSVNAFRSLRMQASPTLLEFLQFAPRVPVLIAADMDSQYVERPRSGEDEYYDYRPLLKGRYLDGDASLALDQLTPLKTLAQASADLQLPVNIRDDIARAAFARATVLNAPLNLAEMRRIYPGEQSTFSAIESAKNDEERRFARVYMIVRHPEISTEVRGNLPRFTKPGKIDSYRENWWLEPGKNQWGDPKPAPTPLLPAFLQRADVTAATAELAQIAKAGSGPDYLSWQVIAWARTLPEDPRVPEALHWAVKSTRYGSTTERSGKFSREAFTLLHKRYPKSPWTAKTPYWF